MLHILWLIMKWILILLAVLLGILLAVILLILFCPVRYRGDARFADGHLSGRGNVSWLFHGVSVWFHYEDKQSKLTIKILGISIDSIRGFVSRMTGFFRKEKPKAEKFLEEEAMHPPKADESAESAKQPEDTGKVNGKAELPKMSRKAVTEELTEPEATGIFARLATPLRNILNRLRQALQFLLAIPSKISAFFNKIKLTFTSIYDKITKWKLFLDDERTQEAIHLTWQELKKLLKHIFPRKIQGEVTFGMEDPATTGQILAVLGATLPLHKNRVQISPRFDEQILEGNVQVKGRIYVIVLVKAAIQLYFNKNIQFIMKAFKHKEG